jgi:predicted dehydrogenase
MPSTLRIGVIGCGNIAYWTYFRELRRIRGCRLVAAADPNPAARDRASKLTGLGVESLSEVLLARGDVDAVVITAPSGLHAGLAVAAAGAGKHIYLEKPIATSMPDAQRVVAAVESAGVRAAVGFNRRYHPAFEQCKKLLASGRLGAPRSVQMTFSEPAGLAGTSGWRDSRALGGGVLLDFASHHVDLLRWILEEEPANVSAGVFDHRAENDTAWIRLGYGGGMQALGYYSSAAGRAESMAFFCEKGSVIVDRFSPFVRITMSRRLGYGIRRVAVLPSRECWAWQFQRLLRPSWEPSYRSALTNFVGLCRGEKQHLATMGDGCEAVRIIVAAEQAALEGVVVTLR